MSSTLILLLYNNVKNNYQSIVTTDSDVDPATVTKFTIVHQGCALYLYVVPILYYDIQYLMGCYSIKTTICDSSTMIDSSCDHNLVHYGVVYTYAHAYYVVQLLLYNIQRSIGCNNSNPIITMVNSSIHTITSHQALYIIVEYWYYIQI